MRAAGIPSREHIASYIGTAIHAWDELVTFLDVVYGFEPVWSYSEKHDSYDCRFRAGGRTLVTLSVEDGTFTVLLVLGKAERERFEDEQAGFSSEMREIYGSSRQHHDGRWLWIRMVDACLVRDVKKLIMVKRKPKRMAMCGYRCDLCKAYAPNTKRKDQRGELSKIWGEYYGLDMPPEEIHCTGCRSTGGAARRIDTGCPVRPCVMEKRIETCGDCDAFPCPRFDERRGLSAGKARQERGADFCPAVYREYLAAYDNGTRLGEYRASRG